MDTVADLIVIHHFGHEDGAVVQNSFVLDVVVQLLARRLNGGDVFIVSTMFQKQVLEIRQMRDFELEIWSAWPYFIQ
mgnify:FL=1